MVVEMKENNLSALIDRRKPPGTQVYALLREEIATVRLAPGTALSEKRLAEEMGVSRTPVREALIRLSEDGLVYIVPKSGTYVSAIDLDAVQDAHLIRESLECATVFLAARHATDQDVDSLRQIFETQKALIAADDFDGFLIEDDLFHRRLIEVSGRIGVIKPVQAAKLQLDRVRYSTIESSAHIDLIFKQHEEIIDCLARNDGRGARRVMREHLNLFYDKIEQLARTHTVLITGENPKQGRRGRRPRLQAAD
jgi:DNA-binding GntR family transcriptional regulator